MKKNIFLTLFLAPAIVLAENKVERNINMAAESHLITPKNEVDELSAKIFAETFITLVKNNRLDDAAYLEKIKPAFDGSIATNHRIFKESWNIYRRWITFNQWHVDNERKGLWTSSMGDRPKYSLGVVIQGDGNWWIIFNDSDGNHYWECMQGCNARLKLNSRLINLKFFPPINSQFRVSNAIGASFSRQYLTDEDEQFWEIEFDNKLKVKFDLSYFKSICNAKLDNCFFGK